MLFIGDVARYATSRNAARDKPAPRPGYAAAV
jgi:hypothetical protein